MKKLTREDLYSLEKYAEIRPEFRTRVIEHKKNRIVTIGPHATLYFENRLTVQYQIQEMLRIERIFESGGIQEELDIYNPLIPGGTNWKATFMIEYEGAAISMAIDHPAYRYQSDALPEATRASQVNDLD